VVTGTQRVPGTTTSATLTVSATWFERNGDRTGISSTDSGHAAGLKGTCKETPQCVGMAQATYKHTFDGAKGRATVELAGDLPLCKDQKQEFLLVSYFAPGAKASWPQYAHDHDVAAIDARHRKVELKVDVPKCYTQVDLVWGGKSELITPMVEKGKRYGDKKLGSKGKPGNRSAGPLGAYNGLRRVGRRPSQRWPLSGDVPGHRDRCEPYRQGARGKVGGIVDAGGRRPDRRGRAGQGSRSLSLVAALDLRVAHDVHRVDLHRTEGDRHPSWSGDAADGGGRDLWNAGESSRPPTGERRRSSSPPDEGAS
jgi:hypothetical protein